MGIFRRREPLHTRLAREGGLPSGTPHEPPPPWGAEGAPAFGQGVVGSAGDASSRAWMETGIHGVPRAREWDAVVAVDAEGVEGDRVQFVALADDSLVVEGDDDVEPIAAALDEVIEPPYRADARRRSESQWVVGLRRIEVIELPEDTGGDEVTLTVSDGTHTLDVDGQREFDSIRELEALGPTDGEPFVVRAHRLDGTVWEVEVLPL